MSPRPRRWDCSLATTWHRTSQGCSRTPTCPIRTSGQRRFSAATCLGHYKRTQTFLSLLHTPTSGGPGLPRLHVLLANALRPGRGVVLPRGPRRVAQAARRRLARASNTRATRIKYRHDACLFTPVAGGVCLILNASDMCSLQGLGRVSNPWVTKAKTIYPLRHVWVTPIMTLALSTTSPGEEMGGGDRTTLPTYSPMQDDKPAYTAAFARPSTRQDEGVAE